MKRATHEIDLSGEMVDVPAGAKFVTRSYYNVWEFWTHRPRPATRKGWWYGRPGTSLYVFYGERWYYRNFGLRWVDEVYEIVRAD